jgi:dTDP-4-amino-4,6-dideoxygalactose transaminase
MASLASTRSLAVPFLDLTPVNAAVKDDVLAAVSGLIDRNEFGSGAAVHAFEDEFAAYCESAHAVGLASGLDALRLALLALGIGRGDEVIVPANTFVATFEAVSQTAARPVVVDVSEDDDNIDVAAAEAAVTKRTRAILPVHLYGQMADVVALEAIASARGVTLVEDACQAHGALYRGRPVGTLEGERGLGALSFYPTKNLGALGDGGAILANDAETAARLRQLRNGGQRDRYHHESFGVNTRLDEMQAALLRVGLAHLQAWNERRRTLAAFYTRELAGSGVEPLVEQEYARSVAHLYVVRHPKRDALAAALKRRGVGTLIHFPVPLHLQPAFAALGGKRGDLPVVERASSEILSLPLYPELTDAAAKRVVAEVRAAAREC